MSILVFFRLCSPRGFFHNPHKLPLAPCSKLLRRDGDSNPGNPFGVYTLSRRASSTTRASLLQSAKRSLASRFFYICYTLLRIATAKLQLFYEIRKNVRIFFQNLFILAQKAALRWHLLPQLPPLWGIRAPQTVSLPHVP